MTNKTSRNAPCPCGSGRKFKHCCGAAQSAVQSAAHPATLAADFGEGVRLEKLGRFEEAAAKFRAVLQRSPHQIEALVNLGNVLRAGSAFAESAEVFERAVALRPDLAGIHVNLGLVLQKLGRNDDAVARYQLALAKGAKPDPALLNNIGLALLAQGEATRAGEAFARGLALAPNRAVLQCSLGLALVAQGRIDEGIQAYRDALASDPRLIRANSNLLMAMLYSDRFSDHDRAAEEARFRERFIAPIAPTVPRHSNPADPDRPLKVGYVSPDFRDHSVAYFIEPVLAHHDARQFEIFAYHTAATTDAVTARMRATVPGWRDCMRDTDVQLAERIRDDGIDVLVDLAGHTANHRLLTFARKPAPVQASWIGYPSTTGVPQIDYRITDPVASPPVAGGDGDSEAFFRLSVAFSCYRPPEGIPRTEPVQDSAEEVITLGSFNTLAKMSDTTIRLWSAVLRKRKNFALLLKDKAFCDASTRARLLERFSEQGVDPSRIRLLARSRTTRDHLAQYSAIDIALDTYPYCGVTTTCEALWMGVPVISLAGDDFASRMGASLLSAAGQDQWVARDPDDFARIVLEVADAPAARARWRRELRTMIDASQLRDEAGVTCAVESAYRTMWQSWCASQVPRA